MRSQNSLFTIALLICSVLLLGSCMKVTTESKPFTFSFAPQAFTIDKVNKANTDVTATIIVKTSQFQDAAAAQGVAVDNLRNVYITSCTVSTAANETNTMSAFTTCTVNAPFQGAFYGSDLATGTITSTDQTFLELQPVGYNFMELMKKNTFEIEVIFHQTTIPDWSQLNLTVQFDVDVDAVSVNGN